LYQLFYYVLSCSGRNDTSFAPSNSTGIRRLFPTVTKSKPASELVRHAITALPSSIPFST